jgi:predicted nuclease of restriction endonuclease-like (RecB) superfamily
LGAAFAHPEQLAEPKARLYYLRATAHFGWSRNVLLNQLKAGAYERAVKEKKTHNFALALPEHFAEQAGEMMKSRYNLEFLGIGKAVKERELEDRLALCSMHHKVFDLGVFMIIPNTFEMIFSQELNGNDEARDKLLSYHGASLILPQSNEYRPHGEFLDWHKTEVFKKKRTSQPASRDGLTVVSQPRQPANGFLGKVVKLISAVRLNQELIFVPARTFALDSRLPSRQAKAGTYSCTGAFASFSSPF